MAQVIDGVKIGGRGRVGVKGESFGFGSVVFGARLTLSLLPLEIAQI